MKHHNKTLRILAVCTILLLIAAGITVARVYCEYVQFLEIGYQYTSIFTKNLTTRFVVQGICVVGIFAVILINNLLIRRTIYDDNKDLHIVKSRVVITMLSFIMALVISTIITGNLYEEVLKFQNTTWFGEVDPIFGWDLGYYIFARPFYMSLVDSVKGLLLFNIIYTLLVYVLLQMRGGVSELKLLFKNKGIFIHTFINLMLYVIATALVYKFNLEDLLYNTFCGVAGAGATDMRVWYVYYKVAPFLLILIVPLSIYFLSDGKFKRAMTTLASFPCIWIIAVVCAVINQSVFVDGDEMAVEGKYLGYNIQMTRQAYGLNEFIEEPYTIQNNLAYQDISDYNNVLKNSNLVSDEQLLSSVNKTQASGTYEVFTDTDMVSYDIDGQNTLVSIAPREINSEKLDKSTDSYSNERYKYTHGTGVVMSNIGATASDGGTAFLIKDIPVLSDFGMTQVKQPRIYYGENTNHTVVVKTDYSEEDYENTQGNIGYQYDGFGGVQMTMTNRLATAFSEGDYRLLFSSQINKDSRALINRNIIERVTKVAPFFMYDSDPYMILTDDGQLKWIIDAYAVTDKYPYSTATSTINYIRNCAKVVVDAYNGNVTFYPMDIENPFTQTYNKMYPTLFSTDPIPKNIENHLRYPQDLFRIQTQMYQSYHVTNVETFYSNTESWEYAKLKAPIVPYYTMVQNGEKTEMVLMSLYSPSKSNGLCAYVTAGSDVDNYGQIRVYNINEKDNNKVYGPTKAESLINENETATAKIKELGQNGAVVTRGPISMIPIKSALIYAQAVYVTESNESAPKLKAVIAVYNEKVAISDSLISAMRNLLSKTPNLLKEPVLPTENTGQSQEELMYQAIDMYQQAKEYNRVGDWENYGKAMKNFEEVMAKLTQLKRDYETKNSFVGPVK